ncbi:phosphatidate cytidylyltransferase [Pisolithus marmoratus]|nr:phosphatidate cytidylyltransferase [Pisolithus marmoratus]
MSKRADAKLFATKSAFDALAVEDVEQSEDEEEASGGPPSSQPGSVEPPKPSKSQQKKAAKLARTEKRKQLKAAAKAGITDSSSKTISSLEKSAIGSTVLTEDELFSSEGEHQPPYSNIESDREETASPPSHIPNDSFSNKTDQSLPPLPEKAETISKADKRTVTTQPTTAGPAAQTNAKDLDIERSKKRQNMITRTLWTFIMIGGFVALLLMGHAYLIILVMLCQALVYREVTALFSLKDHAPDTVDADARGQKDPWSKTLNWYFFAVTNYFLYGESIIYYFKHVVFTDGQLLPFAMNHRIISFTLYTIGFMGFVMSLKRGYLKQQFSLFCWVHMSLLLIVISSHFIVNNILEGLIWFWVPASLVICNDVFAYIWGITLGRTPLIKLSPKKTVEGFVGAFWSTLIFSVLWGSYFMQFKYMTCPVHDLGVSIWSDVQCVPNPVFVQREWEIWAPLRVVLSQILGRPVVVVPYVPYQLHLLVFAVFASLVAPFGGFFASGFKRAFNIKDFGHSIPGHGGMTDRMDCQFLMGVFTYVYYSSLIREHHVTVGSILQMIVSGLSVEEQLELMRDLKKYMQGQGILMD